MYESYIELAEKLNALAPIGGPLKSVLFTTGAEATENAVKIARAATGRSGIIAFTGAFHGRTILASAMTGKVVPYKKASAPPCRMSGTCPSRSPITASRSRTSLRHLGFLFKADVDPCARRRHHPRAGAGRRRLHEVPAELMRALRRICR